MRDLVERHVAGTEDHSQGIWTLMMFELWHRQFVDGDARPLEDASLGLATS